jgi:hypothetical protein
MRLSAVGVLSGLLLWASAASPQSKVSRPDSDQLFTSDLIGWTGMQAPEPLSDSGQNPPQKPPSGNVGRTEGQQTQPQLQSFSGTIAKEGNSYVLRTSDQWFYDLDDQSEAEQYFNQHVVVTGTLNSSGDLIHIHLIQPVS